MNEPIEPLIYNLYTTFSTKYIINLGTLNQYVTHTSSTDLNQIIQWLEDHCYYLLPNQSALNFHDKLRHNLELAKKAGDIPYVQYLNDYLKLKIDKSFSLSLPTKIHIKLKSEGTTTLNIPKELCQLLNITSNDPCLKSRPQIIKQIHRYICDHSLQDRHEKKKINPNRELMSLLLPLKDPDISYTYYNLSQYLIIK